MHVPFNGSPPAVTATIQGETQMMFAVMQPLQAQIQAGKLRALAVTTAKRFALLPGHADDRRSRLSRIRGAGVERRPGRRRARRRPIVQRLNAEINAILKDPEVKSKLNAQGFELIGGTPEDFAR